MPQMINPIHTIECLVDDYGWDAVMDELMVMAATAPEVDLDEVQELLDAAIAVNEGEGSCLIAEGRDGQVQGYQDPAEIRFRSRLHSQPF